MINALQEGVSQGVLMNKKILLVMLAVALVFGMTLVGCKDSDDGEKANTDPKTIVITGITGISKTYLFVMLVADETSNPVAGYRAANASTVTFPLSKVVVSGGNISWTGDEADRWKETGPYHILLIASNNTYFNFSTDEMYVTLNKVDIKVASTTVAFSEFVSYP
jgi:hypothetical protein